MPRQPFLGAFPQGAHYYINWQCLGDRPELAKLVARAIATWSLIEVELSLTLAALMDTRSEAAVGVFLSLQNARAQRDALAAAARVSLTAQDLPIFEAVLALHKSLSGDRNDLAHGIFGVLTDHENALLWVPSAKFATWMTRANQNAWNLVFDPDPHAPLVEEAFVYRSKDLQHICESFNELFRAASLLHMLIAPIPNLAKDPLRDELSALPPIAAELNP